MTAAEFLRLHRAYPRLRRRRGAHAHRAHRRADHIARRAAPADRDAVERLPPPGRGGAGAVARSAGGDPRRADRRARPQPEARDARHHRAMRPEKAIIISTHLLDEVEAVCSPRGHHRARPHPGRRHAGEARRALALSQRGAGRNAGGRRPDDRRRAGAPARRPLGRAGKRRRRRGVVGLPARRPCDLARGRRAGSGPRLAESPPCGPSAAGSTTCSARSPAGGAPPRRGARPLEEMRTAVSCVPGEARPSAAPQHEVAWWLAEGWPIRSSPRSGRLEGRTRDPARPRSPTVRAIR